MERQLFAALSFAAVILFGLLAMSGLLVAGLVLGDYGVTVVALVAMAAAYASQFATSLFAEYEAPFLAVAGIVLQLVACAAFVTGLFFLFAYL